MDVAVLSLTQSARECNVVHPLGGAGVTQAYQVHGVPLLANTSTTDQAEELSSGAKTWALLDFPNAM